MSLPAAVWLADETSSGSLVSGKAVKAAGDTARLALDLGNVRQLVGGGLISGTPSVVVGGSGGPTVAAGSVRLDYPYQVSAKFVGGAPGVYEVTFTAALSDADSSVISRTARLEVV